MPHRFASRLLFACAASSCLFLPALAHGQEGGKKLTWAPATSFKIKKVGGVQPSPDGKQVVYTVTETVLTDSWSVEQTHVYIANADGSEATALTKGNVVHAEPQWSPDGRSIAFLGAGAIHRIRPDGSNPEKVVTDGPATSFKWSPDGTMIAFTARNLPGKQSAAPVVVGSDAPNDYLSVVTLSKDIDGKYPVRKLTAATYHVGGTRNAFAGYDWSPDSKTLAFTRMASGRADDWPTADLWLADAKSGELRPLAATQAAEANPLFSPDGQWLACTVSDTPPTWSRKLRVHLLPLKADAAPKQLAATFDEAPYLVGWSEDGSKLYYTESHRTTMQLFALPAAGGPPVAISKVDGVLADANLNATRTLAGFTVQSLKAPQEGFISKLDVFTPAQVTRVNEELSKLPVPKTEVIRWKGPGDVEVEGLLTYPVDYAPGKRYPLLLVIHGGPAGVFPQSFVANPSAYPAATFAEQGYAVLRCNPRGSTGYGAKFRQANHKDWGGGDFQDLMRGVDQVIGMGVADEKKMGVMGWSYGGFMTAWTITQTKRFKAASVGAAVTDLVSFTGTSDIPSFLPSYFGGEFWDNPGLYQKHSPMFHVKNVVTPALIQHGNSDPRVPISQGYEFYNALKRQGCTTQMVVYPGANHSLQAYHLQDAMQRNLEWMGKYVK
jgi:dipeptidyl aminopeptidase/acylaminoacyl peptidase